MRSNTRALKELDDVLGLDFLDRKIRIKRSTKKLNRSIQSKRFLRKPTLGWATEVPLYNIGKHMNNQIFLGAGDFEDYIKSEIVKRRFDSKKKTIFREVNVITNRKAWISWSEKQFGDNIITEYNTSSGFILMESTDDFIQYYVNNNTLEIRLYGDLNFVESTHSLITENFEEVGASIEWIYNSEGRSIEVPLAMDRLPIQEMYPFLNEPILEYYDRYMKSQANILLLIGPPGTGKTTFIRGLLAHTKQSAIVTYDPGILEKDGFFARFIEEDAGVMVLEDSDNFLKARTDGNTMMHRFLNVGDGLVTTKGKKMVFSTNLPSIRDVDPALVRPGRCFDILNFDALDETSALKLAKKIKVSLPEKDKNEEKTYSIAEIFNQKKIGTSNKSQANNKFGFV